MSATKIEYVDDSVNPITGCTPISPGCARCFAKRMATRFAGRYGYPTDDPFRPGVFHADKLEQIEKAPAGKRIFVGTMGDMFHHDVKYSDACKVFRAIAASRATCLILTKRPGRMQAWLWGLYGDELAEIIPNLWVGTSAEDQQRYDERVPALLKIPAAVRFVSVEPMLAPVRLRWFGGTTPDWVVNGAETGPSACPLEAWWARELREDCRAYGVPFFFKSAGPGIPTPPDLDVREYPEVGG